MGTYLYIATSLFTQDKRAYVSLQHSSLPPDAALLTLAAGYKSRSGPRVVTIDFRHDRLLRLFGRSTVHRTFLVNERGQVLAHPDAQKVIGRADLSGHALV